MELINNKLRLVDLAEQLGVTPTALRKHLKHPSPLGVGSEKLGGRPTGDLLLSIDSILQWLPTAKRSRNKIDLQNLAKVEEQIKCLNRD